MPSSSWAGAPSASTTPAFLKELDDQAFPGWVVVEQSRSEISPAESARVNADYVRGLGYEL